MSSSTKTDKRKKDILILGKGPKQRLEHTLSAEKKYSINFKDHNKNFCLSLHYNGTNSYLFVNGKETHKFKAKDSETVVTPLCLRNISKSWTIDNIKKTGLNGYFYDFIVDYDAIAVDDIFDIYSSLMAKDWHCMRKCLGLLKGIFYRISIFIDFNKRKFVDLHFSEQSRM